MTKFNKLPRRLLLLAVLLASLFVFAESPTGARGCPYYPPIPVEPTPCQQRCLDQYDACLSGGGTNSGCEAQRTCCLYRCDM